MEALWKKEMCGGTQSSGFIQAMMGRESQNPKVQEKFQQRVDERNAKVASKRAKGDRRVKEGELTTEFLNEQKFQSHPELLEPEGFDVNRISKATRNLMRHKKVLTVDEAIKAFYDFLLKFATQHHPKRKKDKKTNKWINYRKTYDIPGMFDRFIEEEGVEVEEEEEEEEEEEKEPSKYEELVDLIKRSNNKQIQIETPEHKRMFKLYRRYKAEEDDTELPFLEHRTETLLRWAKYMSPAERRGDDLSLEEVEELDREDEQKEAEAKRRQEDLTKRQKEESDRMRNMSAEQKRKNEEYLEQKRQKK